MQAVQNISPESFLLVANLINKYIGNPEKVATFFAGIVSHQHIDESSYSLIVKDVSSEISTVVIGCRSSKVVTITFYGELKIGVRDIIRLFGRFREVYSWRDDLYFYIFNEEKTEFNFTVSFFKTANKRLKGEEGESLSNLTLSW